MRPKILFIVPSTLHALNEKGVASHILERAENGFFEQVLTVHPFAEKYQEIVLDPEKGISLIEIGPPPVPRFLFPGLFQSLWVLLRLLWALFWIVQLIRKHSLHLIRATDPFYTGTLAWIGALLTGIPFCVSLHADYDKRFALDQLAGIPNILGSRRLAVLVEKFILFRCQMVLPIRESLKQKMLGWGIPERKIIVIPHGIAMKVFDQEYSSIVLTNLNVPTEKKIISFVGRYSKENYLWEILELGKRLGCRRSDFCIVMVGGGREEEKLKKVIQEQSLGKMLILCGFQSQETVFALRKKSLISLCLMGGFSLIEACAAESAPVVFDVEWHRELIADGQNGCVIAEGDMTGLEKCVNDLLDNPEKARLMGKKAKESVRIRHDIGETSKLKQRAYSNVLDRRFARGKRGVVANQ